MHVTLSTLSAILPVLVAAVPQPQLRLGSRIDLSKRSRMLKDDGSSVDIDALRQQLAYIHDKINLGLTAMAQNELANQETTMQASAILQLSSANSSASGVVPLTDDNGELWQGSILVGNPPVAYTVDFDTGSSDLFLPGSACRSTCAGHTRYNPSMSSSAVDTGKTFTLEYGDGSTVSGEQWLDTVSIAGVMAKHQTLGAAKTYSSGFSASQFPADGLMGMGFKAISVFNAEPVFQTMINQGTSGSSVFAFKLAESGAELSLHGPNPALYKGPFSYTPVTHQGYWQVNMASVKVGNKTVLTNAKSVIIDTGTTLIVGDASSVRNVYNNIPGSKDAPNIGEGFYTVPCQCTYLPSLTFGTQSFPISLKTFSLGPISAGSRDCVGGLVSSDVADSAGFWIVGDVFLQNVYTLFDVANARVGFATLA